jgi:two-component system sensor histidine kinase MtrB
VSFRVCLSWIAALVVGVALVASTALVVLTSMLHRSTEALGSALESVRIAEELEIDLLVHSRAVDPLLRQVLGTDLKERLALAERFVTTEEEAVALHTATGLLDALLESNSPQSTEIYAPALGAIEQLVAINVRHARFAQEHARRLDNLANVLGTIAAALLLTAVALVMWWLRARAFRPLWSITQAMQAFARGDRGARAAEVGLAEFRDVAQQFNDMASALDAQRRAQMTFLGGVVHDLRNPLMVLRLSVSAFDSPEPLTVTRMRHVVERISRQTTHLERMLGDLMDVARIEAGELEIKPARCDLRDIARGVAGVFEDHSPKHPIELTVPEEAALARCDSLRLEQALVNLVSNAIKYSPDGGPIGIRVSVADTEIVVSVSDHGIGIAEDDLRRLFAPFTRVGPSKEHIPGSGLGLYIVQKIARAHGGRVSVDSAPGRGSTFQLHLPRA